MDDKMFMFIYALRAQYPNFSNFSPRGCLLVVRDCGNGVDYCF